MSELAVGLVQQLRQLDEFIGRHNNASTLYGLVLKHGVGRFGARLPKDMRKLANKLCFQHATELMLSDPERFIYCEGYAVRASLGIVIGTHAWVLDRENGFRVVDNTWKKPIEGVYLGIPFADKFVMSTICRKGTYGVIDNWEEGFPIRTADPTEFLHPLAAEIPRDFGGKEAA